MATASNSSAVRATASDQQPAPRIDAVASASHRQYEPDARISHEDETRALISPTTPSGDAPRQAEGRDLEEGSPTLESHEDQDDDDLVPFPRQLDASKPLRPKHYRSKKAKRGLAKWLHRNTGLLLIILAQMFYSTMAFFFKTLNSLDTESKVSANELILTRMSITWLACVAYLVATGDPNPILGPPAVRHLLVLRGFVGFFGLFGLYYSLQYLSLPDATVLTFLSPLATGVMGYIFLEEAFAMREALAGVASLAGVVLIARPHFIFGQDVDSGIDQPIQQQSWAAQALASNASSPASAALSGSIAGSATQAAAAVASTIAEAAPRLLVRGSEAAAQLAANATSPLLEHGSGKAPVTEHQRIVAVAVALLGCVGSAGAYTTIRCIGTRASAVHSVAYFSVMSSIVAGVFMLIGGERFVVPQESRFAVLLLLIGIFGFIAQWLVALGLQREKAGRGSSMVYTQIVFQIVVLRVPIEPLSALGAAIILASGIYVATLK